MDLLYIHPTTKKRIILCKTTGISMVEDIGETDSGEI